MNRGQTPISRKLGSDPNFLPKDAASIRKLAARSMFDLFSSISEGMMLVDRGGRVVWINDSYRKFLPALGFKGPEEFVGRPVEEVVPNTLMRHVIETGKPILISKRQRAQEQSIDHAEDARVRANAEREREDGD